MTPGTISFARTRARGFGPCRRAVSFSPPAAAASTGTLGSTAAAMRGTAWRALGVTDNGDGIKGNGVNGNGVNGNGFDGNGRGNLPGSCITAVKDGYV